MASLVPDFERIYGGINMTRVLDEYLQSVVFLYESDEAARDEGRPGGTGFLVALPIEDDEDAAALYVVTASHVQERGGRFARINRTDGPPEVVEISPESWIPSYTNDDVAVALLDIDDPEGWEFNAMIWENSYYSAAEIEELRVGVGDEVALVGRQVNFEGRDRNQPLVRFGHVSMMPGEPIPDGRGLMVEAYLMEIWSSGGFSGAPVLLTIPPASLRPGAESTSMVAYVGLIGVNTGHIFRNRAVSHSRDDSDRSKVDLFVEENLGLAIVAPIEVVDVLLKSELAQAQRRRIRKPLRVRDLQSVVPPEPDQTS